MISKLQPLVKKAQRQKYAIPAFNVSNLEMAQAITRAAKAKRSPVIIQTSSSALSYAGDSILLSIIEQVAVALSGNVPIVTHLDHGKELSLVKHCLKIGFRSVHMDASEYPYKKNIQLTRQAVIAGHKIGVSVQGELGMIMGSEGLTKIKKGFDYRQMMTDPSKAAEFVRLTKVDTLAVSVGTIHGSFRGTEKIDFQRLGAIAKAVSVPLVLHGGSGNSPVLLKRAIKSGICIINIDTDLRLAYISGLQRALAGIKAGTKIDPRAILLSATKAMQAEAERFMEICGSARKA